MHHFLLPRTDLRVSQLCFGTADLGATVPEPDSFALLDQFCDAGGTFLDTAAIYADWTPAGKGSSEKLLGQWLRNGSHRPVIATKGGHPDLSSMTVRRLSQREVESDVENSLRHLGVEAIDLFYLHRDDEAVAVEEILDFLENLTRAGKIRYYGCSNWKTPRIKALQTAAHLRGTTGFIANQPLWSLAHADLTDADPTLAAMDLRMHTFHRESQMAVVPYSSQANGFFSKIAEKRTLPAIFDTEAVRPLNQTRFAAIEKIKRESGLSTTQIVLGFLQSQPFPVAPIIGCKTPSQLTDSLSAADVKLSPSQMALLSGS